MFENLKEIVLKDGGSQAEADFVFDVFNQKVSVGPFGIKGNTYPHKDYLKVTFHAHWDAANYVWKVNEENYCTILGMLMRYETLYNESKKEAI